MTLFSLSVGYLTWGKWFERKILSPPRKQDNYPCLNPVSVSISILSNSQLDILLTNLKQKYSPLRKQKNCPCLNPVSVWILILPVAVWTTSGCFLWPFLGLTISPNPVTSTILSFWVRKASLSGSGRQMGMVLMLYMSTSSFITIRDRSWPSRMSLSLEVLSQPGWMIILSTASPVPWHY